MISHYNVGPDDILFLTDGSNTVGIIKASGLRRVFIETDSEEIVQFLEPEDLIAASCFFGGDPGKRSAKSMLCLVRDGEVPLVVLKKDHPATKRMRLVVSAGENISLSSCIMPGTHPEQDVLCGRGEMDGLVIKGIPGGVVVEGPGRPHAVVEEFR